MDDQSPSSEDTKPGFIKADAGKARPSLIPVAFRRCLREANNLRGVPNDVDLDDLYSVLEQYELGRNQVVVDIHTVIQAAQYLQDIYQTKNTTEGTFLMGVARVFAMGAQKYSENNWMKCPYTQRFRYVDAFYRHAYAYENGEVYDMESGEHHLLHAGCCLAMLHGIDVMGQSVKNPAPVEKDKVVDAMLLQTMCEGSDVSGHTHQGQAVLQVLHQSDRLNRRGFIVD